MRVALAAAAASSPRPKQCARGGPVIPAGAFARAAERGGCGCPERRGARPPAETQLRAAAARGKSAGCYLLGWFFPRNGL